MDEKSRKIELRSDEVEDILGKVPGWITRNGILLLFLVISILLFGSWIFKIPDVKRAEITVTSFVPPANVEARSDGKITSLFVADNEQVMAGDVLAVIENAADFDDVAGLKRILYDKSLPDVETREYNLPAIGHLDLGTIQPAYSTFYKNFRNYSEFVQLDYHNRKIELLNREYDQYIVYSGNLANRGSILQEEYQLSMNQYLRDSLLFKEGVVSTSDYERTKSAMLSKRAGWQEVVSLKSENDIKMAGIRDQILEMELKKQEQLTNLTTLLEESLNNLKGVIAGWEKQYLIVAPIDGFVTFNSVWSENQNVRTGEKVMTVVPVESSKLLGKIQLPLKGAGEVVKGQHVNIRFENYPYLEYGMVKGEVFNISKVPQDDFYTVEVTLPEGLKTYYGYEIGFSQNMQGQAEILTDNMRLLQRIFNPVRNALSRQREMK